MELLSRKAVDYVLQHSKAESQAVFFRSSEEGEKVATFFVGNLRERFELTMS